LAAGLWVSVVAWLLYLGDVWYVGLVVGLVVGLAGAIAGAAVSTPSQWRKPRWQDLAQGLEAGVRAWLVGGLVFALISGIANGIGGSMTMGTITKVGLQALGDGLAFGAIVVAIVALYTAFTRSQRDTVTPLAAFRTDLKAIFGTGVMVGLAVALAAGFVLGFLYNFRIGLGAALSFGSPAALGAILWLGLRRCSAWWYGVSVALLACRGSIPVRSLRFLEDAYRRGVLRQDGMVYEFRHARLAQHLRSTPQPSQG